VGVDGAAHTVYVANADDGTISVISSTTNEVVATLPVNLPVQGVGVDPSTNRVYVTELPGGGPRGHSRGSFSVINTKDNHITHTITVGGNPWADALNTTTNRLYVVNTSQPGALTVVAGANPQ
jgi:YVTN family beta-propeller protein